MGVCGVCGVSGVSGACVTGEGETYSQYKNVQVGGRRGWEGTVVLVLVSHLDGSRTKWGDTVVDLLQQGASSLPMMVQHIQVSQCDVIQNLRG